MIENEYKPRLRDINNFSNLIIKHHDRTDSDQNFKYKNYHNIIMYMRSNKIDGGDIYKLVKKKKKQLILVIC